MIWTLSLRSWSCSWSSWCADSSFKDPNSRNKNSRYWSNSVPWSSSIYSSSYVQMQVSTPLSSQLWFSSSSSHLWVTSCIFTSKVTTSGNYNQKTNRSLSSLDSRGPIPKSFKLEANWENCKKCTNIEHTTKL